MTDNKSNKIETKDSNEFLNIEHFVYKLEKMGPKFVQYDKKYQKMIKQFH